MATQVLINPDHSPKYEDRLNRALEFIECYPELLSVISEEDTFNRTLDHFIVRTFMNKKQTKKELYFDTLKQWQIELKTNKFRMKHLAKRAIKVIENDIERLWPEEKL